MSRQRPSGSTLQKDSHHVLYELEQLSEAASMLASVDVTDGAELPAVIANALLEDVVLHARGLIEFAYSDAPREDDIVATDFIPNWPDERPPMSDFLAEVKHRADKEMMHITRGRSIAEEVRRWSYGKVHAEVAKVLRLFIEKVPAERVTDDFRGRAWQALPGFVRGRELFRGPPPALFGATQAAPGIKLIEE